MADIRVRIKGVDKTVRSLASISDYINDAAHDGCTEAAEHLKNKIEDKVGSYQSTGGPNGGPWPQLTRSTLFKHMRIGKGDTPLDYTGGLKGSFYVQEGGKGRLSAQVKSSCEYIIHHIYGAPRKHVPKRDPMLCTANEERENCRRIILNAIGEAIRRGK